MERRTKVELFERIRREYEFGVGSIKGVAEKLRVHRRMVRQAISSADPHYRTLHQRINVERLGDLGRRRPMLALLRHHRTSRDHSQRADSRKIAGKLIGHSVAEIFLVRIAREVIERQDRD